ncbi:MAG: sigma-70 family RNA polymerase sigma factor [Deltaproteobacteria bacterium]|nr:sigma-70 family RNA polymerase sigma factor [Deltaproteobacteria bacterium]MBW2419345.1 sigma-70 family RNA polymerase sigma factor [Deltaproteobacteria bacterium]
MTDGQGTEKIASASGDSGDQGRGRRRGGTEASPAAIEQEARWRAAMISAQDGDSVAYQKLLEELLPIMRRSVRARLYDESGVEDVVQNALLSIHRARHTYRPERPFGPWMRTILRNATIDAMRARKRRGDREVKVEAMEMFEDAGAVAKFDFSARELAPELRRALEELPATQRQAVELIQLRGLSVAEAALQVGISPGALKVRAHRGYVALRKRLKGPGS